MKNKASDLFFCQILRERFADVFPSLSGRHPVAVLHLEVRPASLDVNLDPSKTSVLLNDIVRLLLDLLCILISTEKRFGILVF